MNFIEAVEAMESGKEVRRETWCQTNNLKLFPLSGEHESFDFCWSDGNKADVSPALVIATDWIIAR